ncbi:MAG: hypothetical protein JO227_07760 [Acetobacteraceae bacterium]|nr:hypothetical protein [Acetobacteraceae bacterium]
MPIYAHVEALTYFVTLVLFAFVVLGTTRVSHEWYLLACIPPVFVSAITGFIMWVYAFETFGPALVVIAIILPIPLAWRLGRRFSPRDMVISIYLAWSAGMVCALAAFSFPDTL